ncbi:hypothetical protein JW935_22865 [candidate division KSB1 bacterium]|nr:hypothetical protein [candidate division KSB1 bacterium]
MERIGPDLLGPVDKGYLTDICTTGEEAHSLYRDPDVRGGKYYSKLIWTSLSSNRFNNVAMLSTEHGYKHDGRTWMPGFSPLDNPEFTVEIFGPVVETAPNGRYFEN